MYLILEQVLIIYAYDMKKLCKIAQHLRTWFTMYFNYVRVIGHWSRYWKFNTSKSGFNVQNFLYFPIKIRAEELLKSVFTLEFLPLLQLNESLASNWYIKYLKTTKSTKKAPSFYPYDQYFTASHTCHLVSFILNVG